MTNPSYAFAEKLKSVRAERGLSKTALAKLIGVTTTCVWNWEEGNTEPRDDNLAALCRSLNVSPAYFRAQSASIENKNDFSEGKHSENDEFAQCPLSIAQAKAGLALTFGVNFNQIEIIIKG